VTREPASVRSQIESGGVTIGASTEAVVSLLGAPHLKLVPEGGPEGSERWVYTERRIEHAGTITVSRFESYYDREGRFYSHFIMPEDRDRYVTQVRVVALLTFEGGRLVAIDLQPATDATQPPDSSGPNA